jgi:hypothetical protein
MMGELTDGLGDTERGEDAGTRLWVKRELHHGPCMDLILFIYSTAAESHVLKRRSPAA